MQREDSENNVMLKHLIDSQPMDDFEGRSSKEIHYLVYDPFCDNSPLNVSIAIDEFIIEEIPIIKLIRNYLELLAKNESFKLNKHGELPSKIVKSILEKDLLFNEFEISILKINDKPFEPVSISCARIISELAGLAKIRKNEITFTKKGKRIMDNFSYNELFYEILLAYTTKFNWSYFDDFGDNDIGQFGFAYTLDLISKYGKIMHNYKFYSDKYRQAFGFTLLNPSEGQVPEINEFYEQCFINRTIERFLKWFGLVTFADGSGIAAGERYILKSKIFDTLFNFD
jgi:hypothetical protein